MAIWYLLMLAPLIAIAIFWWSYQRKQAAREREARERWQQIVSKAAAPDQEVSAASVTAPAVSGQQKLMPPVPAQAYRGGERLLDPAETLFYFLLRTGFPEFEVLNAVNVSRLLVISAASEAERERLARGVSQHSVDFVLCDKTMQPRIASICWMRRRLQR